MPESKKRGLGRGLSALFDDSEAVYTETQDPVAGPNGVRTVPVEHLRPGRFQPRRVFDDESIDQLAASVRERGILQPLLVRPIDGDRHGFEIVAGERRWRAAQRAQLHEIPIIVEEIDDRTALEIALIENLQRKDLTSIEEAEGYRRLMDEFGHTQEALAQSLGKSRSHVANTLRLLNLPESVRKMVEEGSLSAGHARALLTTPNPEKLAQDIVQRGLSVRQTEKLAAASSDQATASEESQPRRRSASGAGKDPDTQALEEDLSNRLGLTVTIDSKGKGGVLSVRYAGLEQLDMVIDRLSRE